MARGSHHNRVGRLRPKRTSFDLSYEKKFTCRFGELIPVMCDEVVPGDHFTIGCQDVVRFQPMVAPILHEVTCSTHYFFVPYRLLWEQWENFISGGPDGTFAEPIPRWPLSGNPNLVCGVFSLWDYLGFPIFGVHYQWDTNTVTPIAFPLRAYNFIWDEYYRDENFQAASGRSSWNDTAIYNTSVLDDLRGFDNNGILTRNWLKDYFTSALPFQQRGGPVAFPISGNIPVNFVNSDLTPSVANGSLGMLKVPAYPTGSPSSGLFPQTANFGGTGVNPNTVLSGVIASTVPAQPNSYVGPATVDLANGVSFDVAQLRVAVQLQKWLERNARGGVRYIELLRAHFGVSPTDERLQRPEYIGGTRQHVVVSEVLQTSNSAGSSPVGTSTPQATMAGHGLMASDGFVGKYFAKEYGLIMGLLSVTVTPSYEDGIDRQWLRYVNTDFYWPEFVNLSEQGIYNAEIFADGVNSATGYDLRVWGYQPQYDEMRIKRNMVCSEMRVNLPSANPSLSYWHLGRSFSALPNLTSSFISINPLDNQFQRPFAVTSARPLIVSHANRIKAVRPLPYIGEPGLVDHH